MVYGYRAILGFKSPGVSICTRSHINIYVPLEDGKKDLEIILGVENRIANSRHGMGCNPI